MLREPGCDLLSPAVAARAGGRCVEHAAREPLRLQDLLQLESGLAISPGRGDDDVSPGTPDDLVQHLNTHGVQIPVTVPSADRGPEHRRCRERSPVACIPRTMTPGSRRSTYSAPFL